MSKIPFVFWICFCSIFLAAPLSAMTPGEQVADAVLKLRRKQSYSAVLMTVMHGGHSRNLFFQAWTKGRDKTFIRFLKPARERGNSLLMKDGLMWSYIPKINKSVRIPPSMMSQNWMRTDFSYDDLAKADKLAVYYDHQLVGHEKILGRQTDHIRSVPKEGAPVIWGRSELWIDSAGLILRRQYYNQDQELVKSLEALRIESVEGKEYVMKLQMQISETDKSTLLEYKEIRFKEETPDSIFQQSNFKNYE